MRNLADNAARYSPAGSQVLLGVTASSAEATLQIDDAGPGIAFADHDRVFDRFYRRAGADDSGSGLGLAIVRSVADAHGATVALADSPLGGLRVSVRLPLAASSLEMRVASV